MFDHSMAPRTTTISLILAVPVCLWILVGGGAEKIERSRVGNFLWGLTSTHYKGGAVLVLMWTIIWGLIHYLVPESRSEFPGR